MVLSLDGLFLEQDLQRAFANVVLEKPIFSSQFSLLLEFLHVPF